jgi:DNA-binding PadR family transcriptional regulator
MPSRARANPLALAVLACLFERPMHPYEVAQTLRSRAKHETVRLNYGSLYGVVESLEKRGLIAAGESVREGRRPERTTYEITEAGKRELVDWLSDLVAQPVKEYPQFETALSFLPVLPPDEALELLKSRIDALEIHLAQLSGSAKLTQEMGLPRLFELESEYEMHLFRAELEFVRRLVKDIQSGGLDGIDLWRSFHSSDGGPSFDWVPPWQQ